MSFSSQRLLHNLQSLLTQYAPVNPSPATFLVAYSGGLDSHVLLHAMQQLCTSRDDWQLQAIHIDHGLQESSASWARHCADTCEQLGIHCLQVSVDIKSGGESPEAAARDARYAAFAEYLGDNHVLLTAQHADDQAETFLLQALRGSGPRGLSAMPACRNFAKGFHLRPMLDVSRKELQAYAESHKLDYCDDPSNDDRRFDRNFLRHEVMPLLQQRWPAVTDVLGRDARQQAEAAALLDVLAEQDLDSCRGQTDGCLDLAALNVLDDRRQRNLLRYWLRLRGAAVPHQRKLDEIRQSLMTAAADRQPHVDWPGGEVRRFRGELYASQAEMPGIATSGRLEWNLDAPLCLPEGLGSLVMQQDVAGTLDLKALQAAPLRVGFRQGGEVCQPAGRHHHHSLKKLFQEAAVPPWLRDRTPLVFVGDELAQIPGLCVCEPFRAKQGQPAVNIVWRQSTRS